MRSVGISAMISSCMFAITPPVANATLTTGITKTSRFLRRATSQATPERSAPVSSITLNAPPMRKIRKITSARSAIPLGMATKASKNPTGVDSTTWYVPATTTLRPVTGSSRRSYRPAGST